ncbi:MAG: NADPH-dependent FMN reductase [Dehalococcoidia bacterium]
MTRIAAVIGSVTPPGRLNGAVTAAIERAAAAGHDVDVIDLAAVTLDFADGRPPADHKDDSARVIEALRNAEAVVLASPVYRGSYTGALKNLLDLLPVEALQSKPVAIIAMGATTHHYLGVDFHLRDVLTWFGALVAPTSVYLSSADFSEGKPSADAAQRLDQLVRTVAALAGATAGIEIAPLPLAAQRG